MLNSISAARASAPGDEGHPYRIEGATRGRVLVADDEEFVRRAFRTLLEVEGHVVDGASSGQAAIQLLREREYDLVVSDIAMPNLDGMELLRHVRGLDQELPVILATGAPTLSTAIEAVELGALRYLTKPVDPAELAAAVARAIRLRRLGQLRRQLTHATGVAAIADTARLGRQLDSALDRLYLRFQPIVSWSERRLVGYEALVRCAEPTLGDPASLFEAAESLGRVGELGRAIRGLSASPLALAPEGAHIFLNLHTHDLLDESLYDRDSAISQYAPNIVLEITERARLEQVEDVPRRVARLRAMGFKIAVDDIGAGYAGLNSFAQLEPDIVKLDMLLVRGLPESHTKQALIKTLVALCAELSIEVVAEGVETAEERETLVSLGCDWLQGYLFGEPQAPFATPDFDG